MATITIKTAEPSYGRQRFYTALRFALTALHEGHQVNLFLYEDAVFAAKQGQEPGDMPALLDEKMPRCEGLLAAAISQGAKVKICGVCAAERALRQDEVIEGAEIGSMRELVNWIVDSDKVVTF
ncbi:MAG: DsrE family protein [Candidatus Eisenbacteria bacterium]